MHSSMTPSSLLLATLISVYILTVSLLSSSLALPSSPTDLITNRQYQHIIKTRSAAQKYCGNSIVNILSLLCDGNYFSPSKRNSINQDSKQNTLNNGNYEIIIISLTLVLYKSKLVLYFWYRYRNVLG